MDENPHPARARMLAGRRPDLEAELFLYPKERSPRRYPIFPGFGCSCHADENMSEHGWDCLLDFDGGPLHHGERRLVRFHFLSGKEAADALSRGPVFFLWSMGMIGEARPLPGAAGMHGHGPG